MTVTTQLTLTHMPDESWLDYYVENGWELKVVWGTVRARSNEGEVHYRGSLIQTGDGCYSAHYRNFKTLAAAKQYIEGGLP